MINIRESRTAVWEDKRDELHHIHVSEWWNGEGLDITIAYKDAPETRLGLHIEELNQLALIAAKLGYIDIKELKNDLKQSKGTSRSGK